MFDLKSHLIFFVCYVWSGVDKPCVPSKYANGLKGLLLLPVVFKHSKFQIMKYAPPPTQCSKE